MSRPSSRTGGDSTERDRPTEAQVWVVIGADDVLAGHVYAHRRRGSESASFLYDESYLARVDAYALDPALPLVSGLQQSAAHQKIFGAFADSSPDRWGRNLIKRAETRRGAHETATPRSFGEFDLLLRVRDDLRQGAIRYRVRGQFQADDATGVPAMTDLPSLLSAADDVAADRDDEQSLALLLSAGSSLGGARPKAHVSHDNGRIAIAKFPSPVDDWNVMAWEKTALDLAAAAGIGVPANQLVSIAGRDVLIVDRFDRPASGGRVGYMSAMTALEATDGDTRSYLDIAEVLEERSLNTTAELEQLWRRVALFILISNTDDHLRNHAFIHLDGEAWSLSPAFDINPNPSPGQKDLSTAINDDTRADLSDLLGVANLFRLDSDRSLAVLRQVHASVRQWQHVAARNGLSKSAVAKMAPAFEHPQVELAQRLLA